MPTRKKKMISTFFMDLVLSYHKSKKCYQSFRTIIFFQLLVVLTGCLGDEIQLPEIRRPPRRLEFTRNDLNVKHAQQLCFQTCHHGNASLWSAIKNFGRKAGLQTYTKRTEKPFFLKQLLNLLAFLSLKSRRRHWASLAEFLKPSLNLCKCELSRKREGGAPTSLLLVVRKTRDQE